MNSILNLVINHLYTSFFVLAAIFVAFKILGRQSQQKVAKKFLQKAIQTNTHEPLTLHPEINAELCGACGACTRVCPEGDILKMIGSRPVLVSPSKCVGHGECERACPFNAITLVYGTKTRGMDIPKVNKDYETNVPGLYIAGELGGMGLIRNAIKQGHLAAKHASANSTGSGRDEYDLLIVGGGPAGLAAGLTAIAHKKKYLIIEQNAFGGSVFSFPRQKIVMTHPAELPIVGKMKFQSNKVSKEQLLDYWHEIRKKTGLVVKEKTQFLGLERTSAGFAVETNNGKFNAKKVIMATGVRGTPRKLGVPGEGLPKVTYNLLDPEQYQGVNIVVVGGGNAGVEAAQMLADAKWRNTVHLLVRTPTFDRCNEDNINRITTLERQGRVKIWYESSIKEIRAKDVSILKGKDSVTIPNDFTFIFAGAELPHKFLMSLGIKIDKKFGEAA